jgi:hypothetical protein
VAKQASPRQTFELARERSILDAALARQQRLAGLEGEDEADDVGEAGATADANPVSRPRRIARFGAHPWLLPILPALLRRDES